MPKVFLICPVANASEDQKAEMMMYIEVIEGAGYDVHYPHRDTNQKDPIGYNIISENLDAIMWADEVHLFYSKGSRGSIMDFGFSFSQRKPIYVVNKEQIEVTSGKSYENILLNLDKLYEPNIKYRKTHSSWKKLDAIRNKLNWATR